MPLLVDRYYQINRFIGPVFRVLRIHPLETMLICHRKLPPIQSFMVNTKQGSIRFHFLSLWYTRPRSLVRFKPVTSLSKGGHYKHLATEPVISWSQYKTVFPAFDSDTHRTYQSGGKQWYWLNIGWPAFSQYRHWHLSKPIWVDHMLLSTMCSTLNSGVSYLECIGTHASIGCCPEINPHKANTHHLTPLNT